MAYFIIAICKDELISLKRESVGTRGRGLGTVGSVSKFPSQPTCPGNWIEIGLHLPSVVLLVKEVKHDFTGPWVFVTQLKAYIVYVRGGLPVVL